MSEQKCRKVYVPVNLDVDAEGNIRPRLIRWVDGRVYEIDRLKHKCRAASTKVGGCGIRYTVMIGGHESFLYNEDEKWFVEAKEQCLCPFDSGQGVWVIFKRRSNWKCRIGLEHRRLCRKS